VKVIKKNDPAYGDAEKLDAGCADELSTEMMRKYNKERAIVLIRCR
jgi:hypothetical protein